MPVPTVISVAVRPLTSIKSALSVAFEPLTCRTMFPESSRIVTPSLSTSNCGAAAVPSETIVIPVDTLSVPAVILVALRESILASVMVALAISAPVIDAVVISTPPSILLGTLLVVL